METLADIQAFVWTLKNSGAAELGAIAKELEPGLDSAVLSTCTRVEHYGLAEPAAGIDRSSATVLRGREALEHLADVAAGADSLIVGETDVLAQVRATFRAKSGPLRAFGDAAIAAGREARRQTVLEKRNAGGQLDIALRVAGASLPVAVTIVGTGAMAGHLARRARSLGSSRVSVAGRNVAHASRCAAAADADAIQIAKLPASADGSCLILAYKGDATPTMRRRIVEASQRASLVVDLTMPSFGWGDDRPPDMIDLESMTRVETRSPEDMELQIALASTARAAIERWWERRLADGAAPRLYRRVEQIRMQEVQRASRHMDADVELLDVVTKALVKRLFHRYAQALRGDRDEALVAATEKLFLFETNARL